MPEYSLDLARFAQDARTLANGVSEPASHPISPRRTIAASKDIVDVLLSAGDQRITILLEVRTLYLLGFINGVGKRFIFLDNKTQDPKAGTRLRFGCTYGLEGLELFSGSPPAAAKASRARKDIVEGMKALAAFTDGNDLHLRGHLAVMVFLISEAIRFTNIRDKMAAVCGGSGFFRFIDYQAYVQNWDQMSKGVSDAVTDCSQLYVAMA